MTPPLSLDRAATVQQALGVRPDLSVARADVAMARAKIAKEQAEGRWDRASTSATCGRTSASPA
jgi:outer membrane protein TolC